jgi:hypothetical protein
MQVGAAVLWHMPYAAWECCCLVHRAVSSLQELLFQATYYLACMHSRGAEGQHTAHMTCAMQLLYHAAAVEAEHTSEALLL